MLFSYLGNCLYISDRKERVGRRLNIDRLYVIVDSILNSLKI